MVLAYRAHVDAAMRRLLAARGGSLSELVDLGLARQ